MRAAETQASSVRPACLAVAAIVGVAALLRILFYPGFFGSDEVIYVGRAYRLLDGDWTVSRYVGANRYGVNLPVAFFGAILGRHEYSAAAYSLLCSLVEVALVAWFGARLVGVRGAMLAALLLATLPLHAHFAGRLMADAPFGLAATASFLLFAEAEVTKKCRLWFLAGCAAGCAFWIKPAAVFYIGLLLAYPLLFMRMDLRWTWFVAGFALLLLANSLFFLVLTGEFWFIFQNMIERRSSGYMEVETTAGSMHSSAAFYLQYLFGKVHHTWLLGPLALVAVGMAVLRRRALSPAERWGLRYLVFWGVGLLLLLSLLVVSLRPLALIPKQTNYMLIFVAPLCLLGGWALAQVRNCRLTVALVIWLLPALVLTALLQASTMVFTANSKATVAFARSHSSATVVVGTNAYRAAQFERLVRPELGKMDVQVMSSGIKAAVVGSVAERYAIVDTETIAWGGDEPFRRLQDAPACWQRTGQIEPIVDGAGPAIVNLLARVMKTLALPEGLLQRAASLVAPAPAYVYRVPAEACPSK